MMCNLNLKIKLQAGLLDLNLDSILILAYYNISWSFLKKTFHFTAFCCKTVNHQTLWAGPNILLTETHQSENTFYCSGFWPVLPCLFGINKLKIKVTKCFTFRFLIWIHLNIGRPDLLYCFLCKHAKSTLYFRAIHNNKLKYLKKKKQTWWWQLHFYITFIFGREVGKYRGSSGITLRNFFHF